MAGRFKASGSGSGNGNVLRERRASSQDQVPQQPENEKQQKKQQAKEEEEEQYDVARLEILSQLTRAVSGSDLSALGRALEVGEWVSR